MLIVVPLGFGNRDHDMQMMLIFYLRNQYSFGRTLGAGTYGIVKEAESGHEKYAIKIILKKNVKGNERMVYDELQMLQHMHHPNIVRFHDWFESKVSCGISMLWHQS